MIVDNSGNPIERPKSQEEVLDRLRGLLPKNKEQEKILATKIAELMEFNRKNKMKEVLKSDPEGIFENNAKRKLRDDNWSSGRQYRRIASIPQDMVYVAEKIWGSDVLTNREKFKEAFVKDEAGRYCLTVDHKSI
jgi:hypothetical protein